MEFVSLVISIISLIVSIILTFFEVRTNKKLDKLSYLRDKYYDFLKVIEKANGNPNKYFELSFYNELKEYKIIFEEDKKMYSIYQKIVEDIKKNLDNLTNIYDKYSPYGSNNIGVQIDENGVENEYLIDNSLTEEYAEMMCDKYISENLDNVNKTFNNVKKLRKIILKKLK